MLGVASNSTQKQPQCFLTRSLDLQLFGSHIHMQSDASNTIYNYLGRVFICKATLRTLNNLQMTFYLQSEATTLLNTKPRFINNYLGRVFTCEATLRTLNLRDLFIHKVDKVKPQNDK